MWEMTLKGLKPCPFCKSKHTEKIKNNKVHCQDCHASASSEIWNSRPLEDCLIASALKISVNACHMSFETE